MSTDDLSTGESTTDSPTGGSDSASEGSEETTTDSDIISLCGNALLDEGEDCDDGNQSNEDACLVGCIDAKCGDGYVHQGLEECDDGQESGKACTNACKLNVCGDGHLFSIDQGGDEECDDGNQENEDACITMCKFNVCGDGYLFSVSKGGGEECDDGNLNEADGCSSQCIHERRVIFATSEMYKGNLTPAIDQLFGLDLGDAHCQLLANNADLPGVFRAWLSTQSKSPANRFNVPKGFTGIYELPNGVIVAESWNDLTDGTLAHAINVDEHGDPVEPSAVWTNTSIAGASMAGGLDCQGWTSNNFNDKAPVGSTQATNSAWTEADPITCSVIARLYCVQVE